MKIKLTNTVYLPDDRTCDVTVSTDNGSTGVYVGVYIDYGVLNNHQNVTYVIPHGKERDVNELADLFAFEMVCVFKTAIELLGKVVSMEGTL